MSEESQGDRPQIASRHSSRSRGSIDKISDNRSIDPTTPVKQNSVIESNAHIKQNTFTDQTTKIQTRESSQTEVQGIGMGKRKTTLYLSRPHSMAKPDRQRSSVQKPPTSRQSDKDNDFMSVSSFGVEREFTFTGYDIMADDGGKKEKPITDDDEKERRRLTNVYIEACKRNGTIPVTQIAKTIFKPNLCIRHHNLGPVGTRAICVALVNNQMVKSINLEDCWIGVEGAKHLSEMLETNKFITEINVAENRIGTEGIRAIADMMRDNQFVHKLDISGSDLLDSDAKYVAAFMQSNIVLRELNASKNQFGELGGCYIGTAIATNETIENLNLSWNHIRGKGAMGFAYGIANNVTIKYLNISWNGFALDGSKAMSKALAENRILRELDMSCNRIHTEAVGHLMTGVQKNDGLRKLKLSQNPIRTDVVEAMVKAIEKSDTATIEVLDLTDIPVKPEFKELLEEIQKKRPLKVIHGPYMRDSGYIEHHGIPIDGNMNPVSALYNFMHQSGYRVVDLLKRFDRDGNNCVSREEFRNGLVAVNVPLTVAQLDDLLDKLDEDGDGEVDFRELIDGEKRYRQKIFEKAKRAKAKGEPVVDLMTIRFSEPTYKPLDNS